ncbi:10037_t:CDS:2, partial [Dentiscutata heterogama]
PERPKVDGGFERDSKENIFKQMNKVSLFMTELLKKENDVLAALQSLIYESPPEENGIDYFINIIKISPSTNITSPTTNSIKIDSNEAGDNIDTLSKLLETDDDT